VGKKGGRGFSNLFSPRLRIVFSRPNFATALDIYFSAMYKDGSQGPMCFDHPNAQGM